ncbi:MAG: hypothetical protein CVU55_10625 [Deltaproteobacteria bacterium HGW-Deltaproteobacteria-13]|jgi:hypothetical protein|nr:MAG: hypothetical protein CVU55_10625 [Deltaproteobacteria bacterium HGW-Deltaproteobacteria-13]
MRTRGLLVSLLIIWIFAVIFLSGCGKSDDAPLSSEKAITEYSLNGIDGTINETGKTIAVTVPSLTNIYSLVATFTTTGAGVKVGTAAQASGVTANNFVSPLTYTVTAADGSTTTYTVTVTVTRAWHHPASLSDNISPNGQNAILPTIAIDGGGNPFTVENKRNVAMDNQGNAIIVWTQSDGATSQIFKSEFRGGVWHHPSGLGDHISISGQNAGLPKVAMDDNGNAIIVWEQSNGANSQIFKSEYRNGTWTNPLSLDDNISPDGQEAYFPQVAMDNNGNALIVWAQSNGANSQIFKSEYRSGTWTNPLSLDDNISPDGQNAAFPQVAMDDNGNAIIVWYQSDGANSRIFKSEYRSGAWSYPDLTDGISPAGQNAGLPQLAMGNNGNAIIVWMQSDGANVQIFKSEYRNSFWINPSDLSVHISPDGQDAFLPQVAMDHNGNTVIVWFQSDGANLQIFKSEYRNPSRVWVHPSSLSDNISPDGQNAGFPQVDINDSGNAIIVWTQYDGATDQIFKSEYKNGTWTNPSGLADNISPDGSPAIYPQAAMDDNGNAIIIWQQSDSANWQIFKSEYR